jgi:hypothetical protein
VFAGGFVAGGKKLPKQGEWTELRFMAEASRKGFMVMKPWSHQSACDVVIDRGNSFWRVQVKSTAKPLQCKHYRKTPPTIYAFTTRRRSGKAYRASDFHFYALYVIPRNLWYIIPHDVVGRVIHLHVYPDNPKHRFNRYREAWHLLRQRDDDSGAITIRAAADEPVPEDNASQNQDSSNASDADRALAEHLRQGGK